MTSGTGIRQRNVFPRPSSAVSGQRTTEAVAPVGLGGTGATTRLEARRNLEVPGLGADNTFTGTNTFNGPTNVADAIFGGAVSFDDVVTANNGLNVGGIADLDIVQVGGLFTAQAGVKLTYVAKTANYPLTAADCFVNVTANSPTLTLPTSVGADGQVYVLKNSGAGTITLATTSSQTIDGAPPGTIAAGAVLRLFSDGANWSSW